MTSSDGCVDRESSVVIDGSCDGIEGEQGIEGDGDIEDDCGNEGDGGATLSTRKRLPIGKERVAGRPTAENPRKRKAGNALDHRTNLKQQQQDNQQHHLQPQHHQPQKTVRSYQLQNDSMILTCDNATSASSAATNSAQSQATTTTTTNGVDTSSSSSGLFATPSSKRADGARPRSRRRAAAEARQSINDFANHFGSTEENNEGGR